MWVAMMAGMLAFMAIPGVMQLPKALRLAGMAVAMSLPMVLWMKVRGHGLRHGLEMSAAMVLPWTAVLILVALGASTGFPLLAHAEGPAMLVGMLGYMLARREHYAHGGHGHPERAGRVLITLRRLVKPAAYASAILLVPLAAGVANLLPKVPPSTLPPAPSFSGMLPDA